MENYQKLEKVGEGESRQRGVAGCKHAKRKSSYVMFDIGSLHLY